MHNFLQIFFGSFWYLVAIATVANLFVYKRAFERRCGTEQLAKEAFGSFRRITLFGVPLFLSLGALQTIGGFPLPVFPFVLPTRGSSLVSTSWGIVVFGNVGLVFYLSSIRRGTAEDIARVLLADLVGGKLGFAIIRTSILVGTVAIAGIPWLLAMAGGQAPR